LIFEFDKDTVNYEWRLPRENVLEWPAAVTHTHLFDGAKQAFWEIENTTRAYEVTTNLAVTESDNRNRPRQN
jgi:hypothetical protein